MGLWSTIAAGALAGAVIIRYVYGGTRDRILLSQIRDSPEIGGLDPCVYIPPEQDGPVTFQACGSLFVTPYD
jgi:hypothetical protein